MPIDPGKFPRTLPSDSASASPLDISSHPISAADLLSRWVTADAPLALVDPMSLPTYCFYYGKLLTNLEGHTWANPRTRLEGCLDILDVMTSMVAEGVAPPENPEEDAVVKPTYYRNGYDPVSVIDLWCPETTTPGYSGIYLLVLKYLSRHLYKESPQRDLQKARECVGMLLRKLDYQGFV